MRTGVSAVLVGDGLAIVTQRDLVGVLAHGRPAGVVAMTVATTPPLTIRTTDTALDAIAAMVRNEVHHLVVIDDAGGPVGMISLGVMAEVVRARAPCPIGSRRSGSPSVVSRTRDRLAELSSCADDQDRDRARRGEISRRTSEEMTARALRTDHQQVVAPRAGVLPEQGGRVPA